MCVCVNTCLSSVCVPGAGVSRGAAEEESGVEAQGGDETGAAQERDGGAGEER